MPVEIDSGTALNWRYYFPTDTSGTGQYAFAPNSAALDGKYYSVLGSPVTTTIANAEFISAGRNSDGSFWFMTTDKAAANISYSSSSGVPNVLFLWSFNSNSYDNGSSSAANRWKDVVTDAGGTFTVLHNPGISSTWPSDLSAYLSLIHI